MWQNVIKKIKFIFYIKKLILHIELYNAYIIQLYKLCNFKIPKLFFKFCTIIIVLKLNREKVVTTFSKHPVWTRHILLQKKMYGKLLKGNKGQKITTCQDCV